MIPIRRAPFRFALLALAGIGFLPAAGQERDPLAEGRELLELGHPALAGIALREALRRNPDDADAHALLGAALLQNFRPSGQPAEALGHLETAKRLGSTYEHLELEFGRARALAREFDRARAHLDAYRKTHPGSWRALELQGLIELGTGKDREADATFRALYEGDGPRKDVYLSQRIAIAERQGRPDEAARLRETLLREHPDSPLARPRPETSIGPADWNLWYDRRRERPGERSWFITGGLEGGYDTNPLSIGDTAVVPADIAGEKSFYLQASGGGGYRLLWTEDDSVVVHGSYTGLWREDLSSFNQDFFVAGVTGTHWFTRAVGAGGSAGWSHLSVGRHGTSVSGYGSAHAHWAQAVWAQSTLRYRFSHSEYFLETLPAASDLDNDAHDVSLVQEAVIPGTELYLAAGGNVLGMETEGTDYDAVYSGGFFRASHPVVWGVRATAGVAYVRGDFRHDNSTSAVPKKRRDDRWTFTARLDRRITDWATVYASGAWIDNESNLGTFDYDRNQFAVGVEIFY